MAITIKGIRLDTVEITMQGEEEKFKGSYSLMSSADKVLATQTVGGYNGLKFTPSADTLKAFETFVSAYRKDIVGVLGLEEIPG